jgi:drug/metabolite transporter (DMT)-like permease
LNKSHVADGALLLVTLNWGLNFVITKDALSSITPYMYLGLRFLLGVLLLMLIFYRQLKTISKEDMKAGLILGLIVFLGFVTQTVGLTYTTPSKSGFITSSYVVIVPFVVFLLTGVFPGLHQMLGAVITFTGIGIITLSQNITVNPGDLLTLVCAVCFALQIVFTEQYVKRANPINISIVQIFVIGVLSMAISLLKEPFPQGYSTGVWWAVIYASVVCTAGAFAIQNTAQKYTTSTRAAVILCMESVFAGIFSFLFWGEKLRPRTLLGFVLIFTGVMITELFPFNVKKNEVKEFNTELTRPKSPASAGGGCQRAVKSSMDSTMHSVEIESPTE